MSNFTRCKKIFALRDRDSLYVHKKRELAGNHNKGLLKEIYFIEAIASWRFNKPDWIKGVRKASDKEQEMGIDCIIYIHTQIYCVYVQIKSSKRGEKKFWKKHSQNDFQYPIVVLVLKSLDYQMMREIFFEKVKPLINI